MQTDIEVLENNKLIAKFMGAKEETRYCGVRGYESSWKVWRFLDSDFHDNIRDFEVDTPYHSSWDNLMPVVEKIETIKTGETEDVTFDVVIIENSCQIGAIMNDIADFTKESKIKATYLAVIKFIKWYNEHRN